MKDDPRGLFVDSPVYYGPPAGFLGVTPAREHPWVGTAVNEVRGPPPIHINIARKLNWRH